MVLDMRSAHWDRMRDGLVIPASKADVVVTKGALESLAGCALDDSECVEMAIDYKLPISRAANATPDQDGVIILTRKIIDSRTWDLPQGDEAQDDS